MSHPSLTVGEFRYCFIPVPASLINHFSSVDQQGVSDTAAFLCQATISSIISHPMTNRKWVAHFISLPGNPTNRSHWHPMTNRWWVTLFCLCQAVSSIMSHPWPTAGKWYCFTSLPGSLITCLFPWSTESEWLCFISFLGNPTNHVSFHDQQYVSTLVHFFDRQCLQPYFIPWPTWTGCEWHYLLCQTVSSIMSHPMTNRE